MSHGKITDTSIFSCPETTNDYFSLPWDEIGELMVGYNKENANVPQNPEATNLTIAEIVKKEYALRHIFHKSVADAHRRGDIRIHDLGMVDRIYCTGQSPAYIAKYGLNLPDAMTIATPPRHPEVFIGQIIKMSAALQGHFAGAIGWDAFNMFIAPFLEGKTDAEIKQLAQILVFEFSQQAVARGGQSLGYNERIIVYHSTCNSIFTPTIGEFVEDCLIYAEDDHGEIADGCFTPSLNRESGMVEWKPITHVFRHSPSTPIKKVTLSGGKEVVVTSDHSLFTINADGEIIEASADDNCATYLSVTDVPNPSTGDFIDEEMPLDHAWLYGVLAGDGCIVGNQVRLCTSSIEVANRVGNIFKDLFGWNGNIISRKKTYNISCAKGAVQRFGLIGRGAHNKKVPDSLLVRSDEHLLNFLAGMVDSDGNVSRNRYEISTTSEELLAQIELALTRLGFRYAIRHKDGDTNFNRCAPLHIVSISSEDSKKIPSIRPDRHIKNGIVWNKQKHDFSILRNKIKREYGKGLSSVDYTFRTSGRKIKQHQLMKTKDRLPWVSKFEKILPLETKSIEDVDYGFDFVYDIGVKDNENFILPNGIVCHNSVFSDLNLYWEIPAHFRDTEAILPGGVTDGRTYADFADESKRFFKALMEVYMEGDAIGRPFFFPKPDCHITKAFFEEPDWEKGMETLCAVASKMGSPYFIFDRGEKVRLAECCRLSFELNDNDMDDITKPWRMRYAALQNVTINLPRIAYRTDDLDEYIALMKSMVDLTVQAHMDKKAYISEILQLPNSPLELLNMNLDGMPYLRIDKLSYLVGVLGLNEAVEALCGEDMTSSKGREVAFTIMWEMNEYVTELQNKFGIKLVIEQTPAESTAYGLAKLDMQNYPEQTEKYVKGTKVAPYYTNSTQLPLNTDISPLERIKFEGKMHPLIQAGAITHVWLGETLPDIGGLAKVVERTFTHTSNSQIAFSPEFTTCTECSTTHRGLLDKCPKCDSPYVENITRVTGYFSKTKKWNAGKMAELRDRVRQKV